MSVAAAAIHQSLEKSGVSALALTAALKDATAGDVHGPTALGNEKPRKPRAFSFAVAIGEQAKPGRITDAPNAPPSGTVVPLVATSSVPAAKLARSLAMMDEHTAHTPFAYDPEALDKLRADQVPRFLGAITDPGRLEVKSVKLGELRSIQNRVDPKKVEAMMGANGGAGPEKKPVVTRFSGQDYIADGHHRLAAQWLKGESSAEVSYLDLEPVSNALKRAPQASAADAAIDQSARAAAHHSGRTAAPSTDWSIPFVFAKADPDKRQVFGWASIVEKDGQLVIDKQDDVILPHDLEKAAYDYVLHSREMDDFHTADVTGRLIESMVFTREKQEKLGIHGMLKNHMGETIDTGWWCGWFVDSDELWAAYKRGERPEFSIGGSSKREEI